MDLGGGSVRRARRSAMTHPCACCPLRFATAPELATHVREDHTEHPPFTEGRVTIVRPRRFPAPPDKHRAGATDRP